MHLDWAQVAHALALRGYQELHVFVQPQQQQRCRDDAEQLVVEFRFARIARVVLRIELVRHTPDWKTHVVFVTAYVKERSDAFYGNIPTPQTLPTCSRTRPAEDDAAVVSDLLHQTIQETMTQFQRTQVEVLSSYGNTRAKFEYELLQHLPGLEIVVVQRAPRNTSCAYVVVPLTQTADHDEQLLDADELHIALVIPLEDTNPGLENWQVQVCIPEDMTLSAKLVQTPSLSSVASTVDLIQTSKETFVPQLLRRRLFVQELRRQAIVLEYDPVDFSQVVILHQEQSRGRPLMLLVCCLQFTPEYFLTNCVGDLRAVLLDGETSTPIELVTEKAVTGDVDNGAVKAEVTTVLEALVDAIRIFTRGL
ncbi:hypothetical protein Poli38472_013969 [Pythium oligandrum]|uniref:Uncharacterized protein n=1 Tax=Pythium oligandrum TaxID=41045 RepID=A0A8K1CQ80_PYTOL|nr:hypothetical protein Poli38472_013969 [Pythium oligandrum]|eukprot:TMW66657.1 hypothetical protein Poli38472_013969 [Pythium oligandrum]